jgi:hypothetical protein
MEAAAALILLVWVWVAVFRFALPKLGLVMTRRAARYEPNDDPAPMYVNCRCEPYHDPVFVDGHNALVQNPDDPNQFLHVNVTDCVTTWSQAGEPVLEDTAAAWSGVLPQQTAPRQALQAPSPLFEERFGHPTGILTALPQDAAYLVQENNLTVLTLTVDEWVVQLMLLVNLPHGMVRISCFCRPADADLMRTGAFLSYETVRELLTDNIAAGKNVQVYAEPNDYYRQAMQLQHEVRQRVGNPTWEQPDVFELLTDTERAMYQDSVRRMIAAEEHALLYGTSIFETSAPPVQKGPTPDEKAEALLKSWLSKSQLARYKKKGWFEVVGNVTGQRYRIHKGSISNVELIDAAGEKAGRICVVPRGLKTNGDTMLAQKVALETDELAALRVANPDGGEGAIFLVSLARFGSKYAEHIRRYAQLTGRAA